MLYVYEYISVKIIVTDYSVGFGGKFGVQTDRVDKSAVGYGDREELAKHESQKGSSLHHDLKWWWVTLWDGGVFQLLRVDQLFSSCDYGSEADVSTGLLGVVGDMSSRRWVSLQGTVLCKPTYTLHACWYSTMFAMFMKQLISFLHCLLVRFFLTC